MAKKLQDKLKFVKKAVKNGKYRYTVHGAKQRIARRIKRKEIEEAIESSKIIEDYPNNHYGSACLLLGKTAKDKALHILCSLQEIVYVVTVYDTDLVDWEDDLETRRIK